MSIKAMAQVWADSMMEGTALLLLLAIADHANDQGEAWPSIRSMADKIRRTERATQYLLRRLERAGELEIDEQRWTTPKGTTAHKVNRYRLRVVQQVSPGVVQPIAPGWCNPLHQGGATAVAPEPSVEPSVEPSTTREGQRDVAALAAESLKNEQHQQAVDLVDLVVRTWGWRLGKRARQREEDEALDLIETHGAEVCTRAIIERRKPLSSLQYLGEFIRRLGVDRLPSQTEREHAQDVEELTRRHWRKGAPVA